MATSNKTKAPFNWTATADSILEKLQRLCSQISGTLRERLVGFRGASQLPATATPMRVMQGVISSLTALIQARDPYTQAHQERVAMLCRSMATRVGLDEPWIEGLCVAPWG